MAAEMAWTWREAGRADRVAFHLTRIRAGLEDEACARITAVLREVEASARLLRDLHDLGPVHRARLARLLYPLHVLLPCYAKTLRDMLVYLDNEALETRTQWTLMLERLGQQGGYSLVERFLLYIDYLVQLVRCLSNSPLYDPTATEVLRIKLLRFRATRNIPPPQILPLPHGEPDRASHRHVEHRHWAQKIFEEKPSCATGLRHRRDSRCFGPPMGEAQLGIESGSTVLFKLAFDKNRLSVTGYLHPSGKDMSRVLCRWIDRLDSPLYSCYSVHELCIRRKGSCLQFRRWSARRAVPVIWLAIFFKTWEKMVLFHCIFVALKARCPMTIAVHPEDYRLWGERKLFQGQITDDGFKHSLYVFQDDRCHGTRLHAAAWEGDLKRCPIWTAFVSVSSITPNWLKRKSHHRVWIKTLRPYVFCQEYHARHQTMRNGEFELNFVNEHAADAFVDVFNRGDSDPDEHHTPRGAGIVTEGVHVIS